MRKIILGVVLGVLALPASALAHNSSNADKTAATAACNTELAATGSAAFIAKYGAGNTSAHHAFSRCVKQGRATIAANRLATATAACTAASADPNFAATHNGMTFAEFFRRGHDPMTRCVKETVKAAERADKAALKAAQKAARQKEHANQGAKAKDDDGPNHDDNDDDNNDNDGPNHH